MKILVIKQTSLGDVLHSTGHVRAIKQTWPQSELILLTATSSADIYRHNPWVDQMILVDRYRVKHNWYREPGWCYRHMRQVMQQVTAHQFDLAFDLQGLAKSVLFLYGARSTRKFVKGRWPGIIGFSQPELHAIKEMDGVLGLAGIQGVDTSMEFSTSEKEVSSIDRLLEQINPESRPVLIFSPFSRWPSKDWPLENFFITAQKLAADFLILITGSDDRAAQINHLTKQYGNSGIRSLAGKLSLLEFAELVSRARLMLTGDSFPMHVAGACKIPLVALFGPTDETRVGPVGNAGSVIRAPNCRRCDRRDCAMHCLGKIDPVEVERKIRARLIAFVAEESIAT